MLIVLISFTSYSQIKFEPGYFIDNNGKRYEVLIRNLDWRATPESFEYRTAENSEIRNATKENVQEFGVEGYPKYERHNVKIDRSSDNTGSLSRTRSAEFNEETLFLKVLLEGDASLYQYTGSDVERYFYSVNTSGPDQLVYKVYQVGNTRRKNNLFRQQILNDLQCEDIDESDVKHLNYSRSDLEKVFRKYNECTGSGSVAIGRESAEGAFNLSIKAGVDFSSLTMSRTATHFSTGGDLDYGNRISLQAGIEAEYVLPFNKNKWALFVAPSYRSYTAEVNYHYVPQIPNYNTDIEVDYMFVAVPLGARHYLYLNDFNRLFISAAYVVNFDFGSSIMIEREAFATQNVLDVNSRDNLQLGLGYSLADRYSIEFQYGFGREVISGPSWTSDFSHFSFVIGYNFL